MFNDFLKVNQGSPPLSEPDSSVTQRSVSSRSSCHDIAIVGIDCRVGDADNLDDFWSNIQQERDFIRPFPASRALDAGDNGQEDLSYYPAAFLEHVDQFDHDFFHLSYNEACGMDPNQRLLLQSAWRAFEDAGYGKATLSGKKVGIFVGFNSDFDPTYRQYVEQVAPDSVEMLSAAGNIQSVIASRLAYVLDLKGPSLVVDTACSSCLTALHLACQSLQKKECTMALLGGVKVRLLPLATENELGLRSASGRCKTFDDRSDGIGSGEGVVSLILKSVSDAERDGDYIYAVVKSTGISQDGRSVGITAPSSDAQHQLIQDVLRKGDIDPETIALFEAHGTGTKLGDPIELAAIDKAYRLFSDKRQYCAIGSVKSNVGHLDHAAAMTGMIKLIMALKHKKLPPTLHFLSPNTEIDFIDSPLYVNDTCRNWPKANYPRRAALSAFGLSGTNAHAIFEEYDVPDPVTALSNDLHWISLSAASLPALERVITDYVTLLSAPSLSMSLGDIAFTLACGRTHHAHRLILCARDLGDLRHQLLQLQEGALTDSPKYGYHKVVPPGKQEKAQGELCDAELRQLTDIARDRLAEMTISQIDQQVAELYLQGATINWQSLYQTGVYRRVSLPTYPFEAKRCWVSLSEATTLRGEKEINHPLVDCVLADSYDRTIFMTRFDVDRHWVLNEHIIDGNYIIPGTTYVEMVSALATSYLGYEAVELKKVIFLQPVIVEPQSPRNIQLVMIHEGTFERFIVTGQQGEDWITYAQGELHRCQSVAPVSAIPEGDGLAKFEPVAEAQINQQEVSDVGPRWDSLVRARRHQHQVIGEFSLERRFTGEVADYHIHPALMDHCVNIANGLAGTDTYLPFSYRSIKVYRALPAQFSALLTMKKGQEQAPETVKYDIDIVGPDNEPVMAIRDYVIKQYKQNFRTELGDGFETELVPLALSRSSAPEREDIVLLGVEQSETLQSLLKELAQNNRVVVCDNLLVLEENLASLLSADRVIFCLGDLQDEGMAAAYEQTAIGLFRFAKRLVLSLRKQPLQLNIVAGNGFPSATGGAVNPAVHAIYAMAKVVSQELHQVTVTCLDVAQNTPANEIIPLLNQPEKYQMLVWRNKHCYQPVLQPRRLPELQQTPVISIGKSYVITGASGALAQQAALFIASQAACHLCLLSRTDPLGTNNKADKLNALIVQLQATGTTVEHHQVDVANEAEVAPVLAQTRRNYGAIGGIIHTAGLAGDGFIFRKDEAKFRQVTQAKIAGASLLDRLTREDTLDFFVLYSSVTAVFAGMGQSDYTYANAWLDGLVERRRQQGLPALSIQWPAWSEIGMAVEKNAKLDGLIAPLTTKQGMSVLDSLLATRSQGVVMPGLPNPFYDQPMKELPVILGFSLQKTRSQQSKPNDEPVVLKGGGDLATDNIHQSVAAVWASVLGLSEVDLFDSFFNLGGDSILAVKVIHELEKEFGNIIDITDIFTYPTVSQLAEYLRPLVEPPDPQELEPAGDDTDIDTLLSQLESGNISVEEANAKSFN